MRYLALQVTAGLFLVGAVFVMGCLLSAFAGDVAMAIVAGVIAVAMEYAAIEMAAVTWRLWSR